MIALNYCYDTEIYSWGGGKDDESEKVKRMENRHLCSCADDTAAGRYGKCCSCT
ncbi:hypothetical protein D3C76_1636610 [compost metagenome]